MMAAYIIWRRELTRNLRRRSELFLPLLFFILVILLFPFALGPDSAMIKTIAPGIVWVAALLSSTMSLDNVFRGDYDDGSLEQMALSHEPLALLMLAKAAAHWLLSAWPLVVAAAPIGVLLGLSGNSLIALLSSLLLGTAIMSLVGCAASALTMGLRGGGLLLALIILPLYIPVLIFGTAATRNASFGLPISAELYFLGGLAILALTLTPFATAAAVRIRL